MPRFLIVLFSLASSVSSAALADGGTWYESGQQALHTRLAQSHNTGRARNVIVFIGDGMGVSTVTAARIFDGQSRGEPGEENLLSFERLPHAALVKTYNTDQQVADSAGTATAIHTGVKTRAGVIGIGAAAARGDCAAALDNRLDSLGHLAVRAGKAVGIVTTTRLTHATPAAVYAHTPEREWESDADMPAQAQALGCRPIARQLVDFNADAGGLAVALGGGRAAFGKKLIRQWRGHHPDGRLVEDAAALAALEAGVQGPVLGLFSPSHMTYMADRRDNNPEPALSAMTAKAIDILSKRPQGYYLMVEGGRIDHGHHEGIAGKALMETQEFARAVAVALERIDLADTLVLVTADHSHVLTIAGYPTKGNPILGLVTANDPHGAPEATPKLAADGLPYTTLGYHNGPGALAGPRTIPATGLDAHQQSAVPTESGIEGHRFLTETHGGEDVPLYAAGPWAHLVSGVMEQHVIFHIIRHAYGWVEY